jgi:outer membrane protein assembly factor BamD
MKYVAFYLLIPVFLLSSCAGYEKIRRSPDIDYKYRMAMELYQKGKYQVASTLFDAIVSEFRATGRGDSAYFFQAMSYYKMGGIENLQQASNLFTNFSRNFYSTLTEDADFMNFQCYYDMSPRASLDQTQTYEAVKNGQIFMGKYPGSKYKDKVFEMLSTLEEKLVEKSYISARLYFQIGDYKASISALGTALEDYPETRFREEMMFMLYEAWYRYALNSVPAKQQERYQSALDEYYAFKSEFPESRYNKDVQKILESIQEYFAQHPLSE